MDPMEARLKCLELAVSSANARLISKANGTPDSYDDIKAAAKTFSEFVIGPPVIESASQRAKGRDEK